jgi:membrane protease YdiL (CAAX protease family)
MSDSKPVASPISDRAIAIWELVSVVSSLLIAEWITLSLAGQSQFVLAIPAALAFALIFVSRWLRAETFREVGVRLDNFGRAVWKLALPTLGLSLLLVAVGWFKSSLRLELIASPRYLALPFWAFAQQYVLQSFINRRAQLIWGQGWLSALVVGLLFGMLHLPNLPLALLTFIAGVWWAAVYQKTPNLFALAVSHTVLSLLVALSLPVTWFHSMRVGFKYFG